MVNLSQKLKELRKTGKISSKYTIFIYPLFSKVILRGPVRPPIWRVKRKFLLKPVQNLYLGKVSERRLFSSFVFLWTHKKVTGGVNLTPPARDRVKTMQIWLQNLRCSHKKDIFILFTLCNKYRCWLVHISNALLKSILLQLCWDNVLDNAFGV